jgi:hypothetical protein
MELWSYWSKQESIESLLLEDQEILEDLGILNTDILTNKKMSTDPIFPYWKKRIEDENILAIVTYHDVSEAFNYFDDENVLYTNPVNMIDEKFSNPTEYKPWLVLEVSIGIQTKSDYKINRNRILTVINSKGEVTFFTKWTDGKYSLVEKNGFPKKLIEIYDNLYTEEQKTEMKQLAQNQERKVINFNLNTARWSNIYTSKNVLIDDFHETAVVSKLSFDYNKIIYNDVSEQFNSFDYAIWKAVDRKSMLQDHYNYIQNNFSNPADYQVWVPVIAIPRNMDRDHNGKFLFIFLEAWKALFFEKWIDNKYVLVSDNSLSNSVLEDFNKKNKEKTDDIRTSAADWNVRRNNLQTYLWQE